MKTTLTRLFTVMMLIMVSMTAGADVKVLYGKSGNDTFTGGKISATQEVQKDGQVAVTFTIKPDNGYTFTYTKTSLVIVSVYDPSSQSGTRADEIKVSETLWPKGTEGTISYPNSGEYTVTVDPNLGVWVQTVVFTESNRDTKGGSPDYSGMWYIAYFGNNKYVPSDPDNTDNHYWIPVDCSGTWKAWFVYDENENYDNFSTTDNTTMEFLTTYRFKKDANYNSQNAVWIITKHETIADCYFIQHKLSEKYLTLNDYMKTSDSNSGRNRLRVHLQSTKASGNKSLFTIRKTTDGYFLICPQTLDNVKYVNVSSDAGNETKLNTDANTKWGTKTKGGVSGLNVGGTLGYFDLNTSGQPTDHNNKWYLEVAQCATPYISSYDNAAHTVTIESETEGTEIYYTSTTDGTEPADPTTSTSGYTGKGDSPLTISGVTETTKFKAIAVKTNMVNSEVASLELILDPTISVSGTPFVYTGAEIKPTVSINDGAIPSTEYEVAYSNNINAGTATATITNIPGGNYYVIGSSVDFQIGKAPLTVTAKDKTITYGQEATNDGVTYAGFVNNETATVLGGTLGYAYNYSQFDNVGNTYTITPNGLTSDNYEISFVEGTLTVEQKEVGLSWTDISLPYNGLPQKPTATATGTENNDAIGVTVDGAQTTVGTGYIATATELTGLKAVNYKLPVDNTTTFDITKAELTITAKPNTITYGDVPSDNGVTYSGFVDGENIETPGILDGNLSYAFSYHQFDDVGDTYTITPCGLTSEKYEIIYVDGTLTVVQKGVVITWNEPTTFTYNGSEQAPTAAVNAADLVNGDAVGVTVTGAQTDASTEPYTATASGLTGNKAGNYVPATGLTCDFTIEPKPLGSDGIEAEISKTVSGSDVSYPVTVKDGSVALSLTSDYTLDDPITSGSYTTRDVTGANNYTGTVTVKYANVTFMSNDNANPTEWSATFVADADYDKPSEGENITPYIVTAVGSDVVEIQALENVPQGAPLLLLHNAASQPYGFMVRAKDNVSAPTGNLLRVAAEDMTVGTAEMYLLYKCEFVLNMAGTLPEGKVYLPKTTNAGARLMITNDQSTGIVNLQTDEKEVIDKWYSLDGRRLNGKPTKKGLYIKNGQKAVVK